MTDPFECSEIEIRPVSAEEAQDVRHPVLRAGQPRESTVLPNDRHPRVCHLGAFRGESLIGVSTVYPEDGPSGRENGWRLRGMAVLPATQRTGVGRRLIARSLAHISQQGAAYLWCNARTSACPFYRRLGFETVGEEFELPGVGPHFLMIHRLEKKYFEDSV